jgi:hypothetical protein
VTKKSKRKSQLSHKARLRQEKNLERGEAIAERTALKIQKSKGQAKVIESRKKTWDEINRATLSREAARKKSKDEAGDAAVAAFFAATDEEMDGAEPEEEDGGDASKPSIPASAPAGGEEEIL